MPLSPSCTYSTQMDLLTHPHTLATIDLLLTQASYPGYGWILLYILAIPAPHCPPSPMHLISPSCLLNFIIISNNSITTGITIKNTNVLSGYYRPATVLRTLIILLNFHINPMQSISLSPYNTKDCIAQVRASFSLFLFFTFYPQHQFGASYQNIYFFKWGSCFPYSPGSFLKASPVSCTLHSDIEADLKQYWLFPLNLFLNNL